MKKFRFKLEPVLELREDAERRAEIALGEVVSQINRIHRKIRSGESRAREAALAPRSGDMNLWAAREAFAARIQAQVAGWNEELVPLEEARVKALEVYREARREREVLSRLKEKQRKAHHKAQLKEEQKIIDDLTAGRYARRIQGREGD